MAQEQVYFEMKERNFEAYLWQRNSIPFVVILMCTGGSIWRHGTAVYIDRENGSRTRGAYGCKEQQVQLVVNVFGKEPKSYICTAWTEQTAR